MPKFTNKFQEVATEQRVSALEPQDHDMNGPPVPSVLPVDIKYAIESKIDSSPKFDGNF